jgi:uncharacterized membrane protein YgcG
MSEGQPQRSVTSSAQHRQETEVAAAEKHERAAAETAATVARAARMTMAELVVAKPEVEAAAAADAARVAVAELEALRYSSISSSVSTDGGTDDELKLVREAAREQAAQWVAVHPQGRDGGSPDGRGRTGSAPSGGAHGGHASDGGGSLDRRGRAGGWVDATFTGGVALPPRTGPMITMGSRPLPGPSVKAASGLPSRRPTMLSGPR